MTEDRKNKMLDEAKRLCDHIDKYLQKEHAKELEEENNKLLDVINNQDVKIADLEKENAELPSIAFQQGAEWYKKKADIKLTKAIGIIKRWYETNRSACIEPSQELIEVTEQFLKEIEK